MNERVTPEMVDDFIKAFFHEGLAAEEFTESLRQDVQSGLDAAFAVAPEHPAVAMLRQVQWASFGQRCKVCGNERRQGHAPDCELAKLIGDKPNG